MEGLEGIALATIVCSWTFTALVFLALALQFYTYRYLFEPPRRIDRIDCLTIFTFVCSLALICQTTWAVVDEGQGKHTKDEAPSQFELVAKSLTANEIVWTFITMLIRCTAIWFLFPLFRRIWIQRILPVMLILTILHGTASILAACLICQPIAVDWNSSINGICGNQTVAFIAFESAGLVLDVGIVLLPLFLIHLLQWSFTKKVKYGSAFGIGSLNIIFTGLRFASLQRVTSNDFTYDRGFLGLLSCLGALSGVLLGAIPGLLPLFRKINDWIYPPTSMVCHPMKDDNIRHSLPREQHVGEKAAYEPPNEFASSLLILTLPLQPTEGATNPGEHFTLGYQETLCGQWNTINEMLPDVSCGLSFGLTLP